MLQATDHEFFTVTEDWKERFASKIPFTGGGASSKPLIFQSMAALALQVWHRS
jgi:hypothetical protein